MTYSSDLEIRASMEVEFTEAELTYKPLVGLKTGLAKLDKRFQFTPGFHIVVGAPGAGKSWLATWLAEKFWEQNKAKSVYFSLEMSKELIQNRLLQQWSQMSEEDIKTNDPATGRKKIMSKFCAINLFTNRTPQAFSQEVKKYVREGYRVFLFDHIHQLQGMKDVRTNGTISQQWGECFEKLRSTYPDILLIIFAQPVKGAFHKIGLQMEDISDSAPLIYKADTFISISSDEIRDLKNKDDSNEGSRYRILWCDKNRLTGKSQIGVRVYFAPDANYYESESEYLLYRSRLINDETDIEDEQVERIFSSKFE